MRLLFGATILGLAAIVAGGSLYATQANSSKNFGIAILGDSIVADMAPARKTLHSPFSTSLILGYSGSTVEQIAARVGSVSGADTVIVEGGTNDLLGLGTPDGIVPGYTKILDALVYKRQVVVWGIPQVDELALEGLQPKWKALLNNALIKTWNANIAALCLRYKNCKPAYNLMSLSMVGKTRDGIHPKQSGYSEILELMPLTK